MSVRVCDLVGGDVVSIGRRSATFIGRSDHPKYTNLALVVWRLDDGTVSLDALDYLQDVGEVTSKRFPEWKARLEAALPALPEPQPQQEEQR